MRSRIVASILIVAALGMSIAGATAYLVQRERTLEEVDRRLLTRIDAARFVVTGESEVTGNDEAVAASPGGVTLSTTDLAVEAVLARVIPSRYESSLGLLDGRPTFVPGVQIDFHLEDDPAFLARVVAEVSDGTVRLGTAETEIGRLRYIATPVQVVGDPAVGVYITAVDVDAALADLTSTFRIYTGVAIAALAGIALVGWFVAGRLLRPIRQLRSAASRITASDRRERIPVVGRDDVSDLTRTVNDMLDRLDGAMTSQRQLLDDVRHELKTPVTIVRGHLELLDARDVDDVEATRALAIDELDRMTGLIDDIESLAVSDRSALRPVPVDLADLTTDVFAKASVIGGHEWVLADSAAVRVELDPARITQAWLQLVDNAAKYSEDGTRIELGSSAGADEVELWVSDRGPGIPRGSEDRVFERFGRVDVGRSIRGSGLGLPIVKSIAESHGGRITLVTSPAGSRFGIVLPLATTQTDPVEEPA